MQGQTLPSAGFPQYRLVIEIEVEVLFLHQAADSVCGFGNVHIEERKPYRGQHTALSGAGVHVHKTGIQQLFLGCFIRGGDVGHIHLIHQMLGDEERQLGKLMYIALHGHEGNAQRNAVC